MALRYRISSELGGVLPDFPDKVARVHKPAVPVEFRRGTAMKGVVEEVMQNQATILTAATAAGKSVEFPSELVMRTRKRVFHVVPGNLLAVDFYNFLNKRSQDDSAGSPSLSLLTEDGEIAAGGLVLTSASTLVVRMLTGVMESLTKNTILFLDEAHESDAYTYVLRNLALSLGFEKVILASATMGPDGYRKQESPGAVDSRQYSGDLTPESWNVNDNKLPWCVAAMPGNLLVFSDSPTLRKTIARKYADAGLDAFILTANMQQSVFCEAMRAMRDKTGPLVVLVADYSFRSGYTFDVSTIVDTGRVSYMDATAGKVRRLSRRMFHFEKVQASGRGGRLPGLKTKYFYPDWEYESSIVDLEGVEAQAVALLYRALGYKPPVAMCDLRMAKCNPKMSLGFALSGEYPLGSIEVVKQSPSAQNAAKVVDESVDVSPGEEMSTTVVDISGAGASPTEACSEALKFLNDRVDGTDNAHLDGLLGYFVFVDGMCRAGPGTGHIDKKFVNRSIQRYGVEQFCRTLDDSSRRVVIAILCDQYNEIALRMAGVMNGLNRARREYGDDSIPVRCVSDLRADLVVDRQAIGGAFEDLLNMVGRRYHIRSLKFPEVTMEEISDSTCRWIEKVIGPKAVTPLDDVGYNRQIDDVTHHRRSRVKETMVTMPRWTGIKTLTLSERKGKFVSARVEPTRVVRKLTGDDAWHYTKGDGIK